MARLIMPADFTSQRTLLANIISEDELLGAESPLKPFLAEQNIVLADDATAGNSAQTHETNRLLLSKQSENYRQLRDNAFNAPWKHITSIAQFLKKFYKGNTKELGNWGYNITGSGKINYPPAFNDRVSLFAAVVQKNADISSPLPPYLTQNKINLATDSTFTEQATGNNTAFTNAALQSENETQLRNQAWEPVMVHIRDIGNYLMELFANNQKALGEWGFVVDNSPKKPKLRTTKLKLAEKKTINGVVLGSTLTNTGETDIHVYKGKSTAGTPFIIHKGEQFGIQKGFSSITVINPSTLQEGKFTWLSNNS